MEKATLLVLKYIVISEHLTSRIEKDDKK